MSSSRMSAPRSLFAPVNVLSRAEAQEIAQRALRHSPAEETRVTINSTARADTRFALNQVTTSGENQDTQVTITATVGNRSASVNTNRLDEASLAAAAKQAHEIAQLVPPNPERMPELGAQTYPPLRERALSMPSPAERAAAAKIVTELARANNLVATGFIECRAGASALANSKGLFAYDATSTVTMTATVRSPDGTGSGWACSDGSTFADLDPAAVAATAVQKARDSRSPVAIEPGRYTTILEPTAVGNLVQLITGAMQARAADEGRSFFSKPGGGNKLGLKVVDDRVTLLTDPADAPSMTGGFDGDGVPLEKVVWIENGVVKNLNYDRYWAQQKNVAPTRAGGGGFGGARSLRMLGGTSSIADMVKSTARGVLVTRFWYIRSVDPRTILYTGLTRDGTFLIENGKVTRPIKNFRFNESPIFFLNNLEALGPSVRINASENLGAGGAVYMPPLKVRDFTFSSLSDAV
ncbi:MAG: TldD/PmbA family protein [Gemmatimonadetes bacterium]|nr:TldD/PmbA family protein [Gemmatimonadota bacterium]